jgi:hypothetical protein
MSPPSTSGREGLLEHPDDAFAFDASAGVEHLVCQERHMGPRPIVLLCRDAEVASSRFGATDAETGAAYTRTGRLFFYRSTTERFLGLVRSAADRAGLWGDLDTDWLLLDGEILPWSAKAGEAKLMLVIVVSWRRLAYVATGDRQRSIKTLIGTPVVFERTRAQVRALWTDMLTATRTHT